MFDFSHIIHINTAPYQQYAIFLLLPFRISISRRIPTISSALYVFRGIFIIPLFYFTTAFLYLQLDWFLGGRSHARQADIDKHCRVIRLNG
ncbi:MAG TPA: hypothetical protein PK687_05330, partial [Candidatus Avimonas sp.]|nr:hypothetical protein [Candidatus Avimonas sp.]HQD38323.1 hypothetical protein [Candidatus Avimonas sp.]